jgi:uncharacterized protein
LNEKPTFLRELDGKSLYYSFLAGAERIFENQNLINKINVFPVADADTGTNLASTMRSIIDSPIPTDNIKVTAIALADAALVGARGNSGIIFAQFLYGFSSEIESEVALTVESFARNMRNAVRYAYESIANPVEGTMITVIKDWAEFIYAMKELIDDFVELLIKSYNKAKESLQRTTSQMELLRKANVVDAGAKGFVVFLGGMLDFFENRTDQREVNVGNEVSLIDLEAISHEEITFRYCSEALISFENESLNNKEIIREGISSLGDSLVIAGSAKKLRIHIHTDKPVELFDFLGKRGTIIYQKVDDMVMQNEIASNRKSNIGLLTDSTCDLPDHLLEKYQIQVVPLSVHVGKNYFLDRTTITSEKFYDLLDNSPIYPSTSQPTYKDFINKYSFLGTHYESLIALHLTKNMSGTFSNSERAALAVSEQSHKRISVVNSNRISSALGLSVLRAARAIEDGASHDEVLKMLDTYTAKNKIYVSARSTKYMVKSGRLSQTKGIIGKLLNVKPVITVNDEGRSDVIAKPFTEKASVVCIMREIEKHMQTRKVWGYAISHIRNQATADVFAGKLEQLTGKPPEFINHASPVLGVNGGPGIVVVSVMFE